MKIAISTDNKNVAQHFGRCMQYTIVEIEDNKVINRQLVDNPGHAPGAIPKFLDKYDCKLIVAGGMGQRAQGFFKEFDIDWIIGVTGDVDLVIENYINGTLASGDTLCEHGEGKGDGSGKCH